MLVGTRMTPLMTVLARRQLLQRAASRYRIAGGNYTLCGARVLAAGRVRLLLKQADPVVIPRRNGGGGDQRVGNRAGSLRPMHDAVGSRPRDAFRQADDQIHPLDAGRQVVRLDALDGGMNYRWLC